MSKKIGLFMHGGSGNRGCEAILKTTIAMLPEKQEILLATANEDEDIQLNLGNCQVMRQGKSWPTSGLDRVIVKASSIVQQSKWPYVKHRYAALFKHINECDTWISIGGDNYCYPSLAIEMAYIVDIMKKNNRQLILWGCSIEPEFLKDADHINHINQYDYIFARESLTYNALKKVGFASKINLFPDPAFTLTPADTELPEGFKGGRSIGINVSPLITGYENVDSITLENYHTLIQYIIKNTDYPIVLIPHVFWKYSDDYKILEELEAHYKHTGRIFLADKLNSQELKSLISDLRIFIGARTHATIAAYSMQVPTLVVGYSVKAKGIAKDIFGSWENYVIPVQSLDKAERLLEHYLWLEDNYDYVKKHLADCIPQYVKRAQKASDKLQEIIPYEGR